MKTLLLLLALGAAPAQAQTLYTSYNCGRASILLDEANNYYVQVDGRTRLLQLVEGSLGRGTFQAGPYRFTRDVRTQTGSLTGPRISEYCYALTSPLPDRPW